MNPDLKLDNQLCFRLYAASRLVTRLYQPQLEPLGLTYPQYLVLLVLWEQSPCNVKTLGERLLLQSNTLTPLLKRLEQQGLIHRERDAKDERVVWIQLSEAGQALEAQCACIPAQLLTQLTEPKSAWLELGQQLDKVLAQLKPLVGIQ